MFQVEGRSRLFFILCVLSSFAFAKAPQTAISKKIEELQYPNLPVEIVEKIQGKRATQAISAQNISTNLEWPLVNIGFIQTLKRFAQPAQNENFCSDQVVVAVIDTGIDYTHPALKENIWVNAGETGLDAQGRDKSKNGIDDDGNGFIDDVIGWDFVHEVSLPMDNHGHGTHIAGIISARPTANVSLSGVCPGVAIMPLKYYDNTGLGFNNLTNTVKAIHYAIKMGAQIINYSGGGAEPAPAERAAIELARKRGILVIAAAGNDGHNNDLFPYYPASYGLDNIISVASLNKKNELLPSSNWGRNVQVGAPGLGILSTLPQGKIGTMSGTSQATAFVTGAAAILISEMKKTSNKKWDYKLIKKWIESSTKPLPRSERVHPIKNGILSIPDSLALVNTAPKKSNKTKPSLALRPTVKNPL